MIPTNYDVTGEPLNDMKEVSYPETHNFSLMATGKGKRGHFFHATLLFIVIPVWRRVLSKIRPGNFSVANFLILFAEETANTAYTFSEK